MKLVELIDISAVKKLCESFTAITGAVIAVLDLEGNILIAAGWQDICTRYHRSHPITASRCRDSDTALASRLGKKETYSIYKCKNGLVDVAVPIIIGNEHVANLFTGQFLFEVPDQKIFIRQAEEFGFNKSEYLQALDRVPIFSENQVKTMMNFLSRMAKMIAEMGFARKTLEEKNAQLSLEINERKKTEEALRNSERKFRAIFDQTFQFIGLIDTEGIVLEANEASLAFDDISVVEVIGKPLWESSWWQHSRQLQKQLCEGVDKAKKGEFVRFEATHIKGDGSLRFIDFSLKPVKNETGKIIYIIPEGRDITERKQAEEELRRHAETIKNMAYFDLLTGLPNRHHLSERLNKELELARAGAASGFVLFIDLDDLKMVNDTYGHTCGDNIIMTAGNRIVAAVGEKAFVARIGGDEFVVIILDKSGRMKIDEIVHRIIQELGQKQEIFGTDFYLTASIGIAAYPTDGDTVEEIIKNADNAMYAAKIAGKNCARFYTSVMQTKAYEKMRLISSLRYALERGELSLVYQPQIFTAEGTVVGFEALLRWNSLEYGTVPPALFIPLAEQSGFIHVIGQWVLHEVCQFARRLSDRGWSEIPIAVNISAKQLAADDFIAVVHSAVEAAGIEPRRLELEITESVLMTSLEDATDKLTKLKNLGVRLSLDDFGTGYSSLTYLRNLPIEKLKIDKSFIDMITADIHSAKIISAIINMAHILNMEVVAEGVETKQQLEYLAGNGCDYIQGYIFSRPIPETEAVNFLTGSV